MFGLRGTGGGPTLFGNEASTRPTGVPMRLMSFRADGHVSYGAATPSGIVDLKRRCAVPSLRELIALAQAPEISAILRAADESADIDYRFDEVAFLPPVTDPEKIWCIGVNYPERNAEYKDASQQPAYPSLFARSIRSLVGHGAALERPRASEQLDYEGEIALVIGAEARHLTRENALDHVFGLTLCNEGTVRDWLRHGKFNVTQGKNFDRSGSLGPWIVTADAVDLAAPLSLETRVNGEVRQQDTTGRLIFSFVDLLVYLSTFATLAPGDVIVTGTPTGAGARREPPVWLKPGDVVEVACPEIGLLQQPRLR